jgi:hypothetical protein
VHQERGQARLPDHELIGVETRDLRRRAFQHKVITQVKESRGWEGGLAPALFLR